MASAPALSIEDLWQETADALDSKASPGGLILGLPPPECDDADQDPNLSLTSAM